MITKQTQLLYKKMYYIIYIAVNIAVFPFNVKYMGVILDDKNKTNLIYNDFSKWDQINTRTYY
jgi:hypothetical protein